MNATSCPNTQRLCASQAQKLNMLDVACGQDPHGRRSEEAGTVGEERER